MFTCSSAPAGPARLPTRPAGPGSPCAPPRAAGKVRVVEGDHLRAVAPPRGPRQILPLRSCDIIQHKAQPPPFMSGRLYCLASTESNSCSSVGLGNLRLHPAIGQVREACVADHVARVARNHKVLWFVVRDSCVERLTSALLLIMMR